MQIEYIREAGSRGIRFFVPSNIDDQFEEDRLFRALADEHQDSTLVLIKCGHWPDRHGRSCDLYTLRRKTPLQRNNAETPADPPAPTPRLSRFAEFCRICTGIMLPISGIFEMVAAVRTNDHVQGQIAVLSWILGACVLSLPRRGFRRG